MTIEKRGKTKMSKVVTIIKKQGQPDQVVVKQQTRPVSVNNKKAVRRAQYRIPKLVGR